MGTGLEPTPVTPPRITSTEFLVNENTEIGALTNKINSISLYHRSRKFEETNEMLYQFNLLSDATYTELQQCYKNHAQTLKSLKTDLSCIFQRVRYTS